MTRKSKREIERKLDDIVDDRRSEDYADTEPLVVMRTGEGPVDMETGEVLDADALGDTELVADFTPPERDPALGARDRAVS
jgi:hypothetical protein